jgi:putative FmdB family regulatory protein
MPIFKFDCPECGLTFEKLVQNRNIKEMECIHCAFTAQKRLSAFNSQFADAKNASRGFSGVYDLDVNLDKNLGRDAQNRWEIIKNRESQKDRMHASVAQQTGVKDARVALKRDLDLKEPVYEPMTRQEVLTNVKLRREARAYEAEMKKG